MKETHTWRDELAKAAMQNLINPDFSKLHTSERERILSAAARTAYEMAGYMMKEKEAVDDSLIRSLIDD